MDLLELLVVLNSTHCCLEENPPQSISSSLTDTRQSLPLSRTVLHYRQSGQLLDLFRVIKPVNGSHLGKEPDHREVANSRNLEQLICMRNLMYPALQHSLNHFILMSIVFIVFQQLP